MRKIDPNYYRDNVHQRARGRGNILLNGSNNNIHLSSAITHPPKEVDLKVIANVGVYIAFFGMVVVTLFYLLTINVSTWLMKNKFISTDYLLLVIIISVLIIGAFAVWVILWTDKLSFMIKTAHIIYKDQAITYNGRDRKFYDEIWDIQRGSGSWSKVIYCYGINPNAKRKPYRLRLVFLNEEEAKYLYDVFHAGKYLKREN